MLLVTLFSRTQGSRPRHNSKARKASLPKGGSEEEGCENDDNDPRPAYLKQVVTLPGRIVLASVENLPLHPPSSQKRRKSPSSAPSSSFKAAKTATQGSPPSIGPPRRKHTVKPKKTGVYRSFADDCLDFLSSDSLVDATNFKQVMADFFTSQDDDTGKFGRIVLDGKMTDLFKRFVKLQTFVIESINRKFSLSIKSLTLYGVVKTTEAWAALGPELSETLSSLLDSYMKIVDDAFSSIGNLLIDPVSILFFVSVHIIDAYKSKHSDKQPFLMQACKGLAKVPPHSALFFVSLLTL